MAASAAGSAANAAASAAEAAVSAVDAVLDHIPVDCGINPMQRQMFAALMDAPDCLLVTGMLPGDLVSLLPSLPVRVKVEGLKPEVGAVDKLKTCHICTIVPSSSIVFRADWLRSCISMENTHSAKNLLGFSRYQSCLKVLPT